MRIILVADTFVPHQSSAAVQLRDLSREIVRQGHDLTVLLPSEKQVTPWVSEDFDGVRIIRLKSPRIKDVSYIRRTLAEFIMPFAMLWRFRRSGMFNGSWDGVVWYSPSIFHGPLVQALKRKGNSRSYLIIRDIFPEWAVDMGLMSRGIAYYFFKLVAYYQNANADVIGVQSSGNLSYFENWKSKPKCELQVLHNWLAPPARLRCSIRLNETHLSGRKVFVYSGNMGVAQGMDILLDLAEELAHRNDLGFLFVGRGSETQRLKCLLLLSSRHLSDNQSQFFYSLRLYHNF